MKNRRISISTILSAALAAPMSHLYAEGETTGDASGGTAPSDATTAPSPVEKKPRKARAAKAKKPASKKIKSKADKKSKPRKAKAGEKAMSALKIARKQYVAPKGAKTAGGNQVVDSGDATAKKLRGLELSDVYEKAAKVKGVSAKTLKSKYSHLNPGAQRMTLGNIIRAAA